MRNCTRDEGRSFEAGSQVLASNRCKLLSSKAMVVSVAVPRGVGSTCWTCAGLSNIAYAKIKPQGGGDAKQALAGLRNEEEGGLGQISKLRAFREWGRQKHSAPSSP
jgi:hypothetical protein